MNKDPYYHFWCAEDMPEKWRGETLMWHHAWILSFHKGVYPD